MRKDSIIVALIFTFLIATMIVLSFKADMESVKPKSQTKVDFESVQRPQDEIANDEVIYLDEEAIALNGSPVSTELRNLAISTSGQINTIRVQNGVNELLWDENLEYVANVRAKEIVQEFSHTRPNGKPWYTVNSKIQGGENLAYGFETSHEVIDAWMNSESHRDNILYADFTRTAIAIYVVDDVYYWVQAFGY